MTLPRPILLTPYPGTLYVTRVRKVFVAAHKKLYGDLGQLENDDGGRCVIGYNLNGCRSLLVYAENDACLVHELSHVVMSTLSFVGINPADSDGEAFCYLITHLYKEATKKRK